MQRLSLGSWPGYRGGRKGGMGRNGLGVPGSLSGWRCGTPVCQVWLSAGECSTWRGNRMAGGLAGQRTN